MQFYLKDYKDNEALIYQIQEIDSLCLKYGGKNVSIRKTSLSNIVYLKKDEPLILRDFSFYINEFTNTAFLSIQKEGLIFNIFLDSKKDVNYEKTFKYKKYLKYKLYTINNFDSNSDVVHKLLLEDDIPLKETDSFEKLIEFTFKVIDSFIKNKTKNNKDEKTEQLLNSMSLSSNFLPKGIHLESNKYTFDILSEKVIHPSWFNADNFILTLKLNNYGVDIKIKDSLMIHDDLNNINCLEKYIKSKNKVVYKSDVYFSEVYNNLIQTHQHMIYSVYEIVNDEKKYYKWDNTKAYDFNNLFLALKSGIKDLLEIKDLTFNCDYL